MKKLYTLLLISFFALGMANAQEPLFFSEYIEGSSNNKALEIHNPTDAAVVLDAYQIVGSRNGGGWEYYHIFPTGASIEAGDVYVLITDQTDPAFFPAADADEVISYSSGSPVHHNGDDARGIVYITTTDTTLIDVIGIPDEDPYGKWDVAGVEDATGEHTLVRKNHILVGNTDWAAAAGTSTKDSEWIVYEQNFFDSLGVHTYIPIVDVATINLTGAGDATTIDTDKGTLQISAEVLPTNATDKSLEWSVSDNTLATVTADGLVSAINDGVVTVTATAQDGSGVTGTIDITNSNQTLVVPVATVNVTGTDGATSIMVNNGTLQMLAEVLPADASDATVLWSVDDTDIGTIDASGMLTALSNGTVTVTATANDGFGALGTLDVAISDQFDVELADLTALKAQDPSDKTTVYKITGKVLVTRTESYRNKKYVQDAAGGVLIDDSPGAITTVYAVGDSIAGLLGTIEEYNGMLQLHPVSDPGAALSSGNSATPLVVTPTQMNEDHDLYESRVITLESVTFTDADGTAEFENGKNYEVKDAADTAICRTEFWDSELSGTVIPDSAHVTGILIEYKGTAQLSPRTAADVEALYPYVPSDDASITDLLIDGTSVTGFTPAQLSYDVVLHHSTTTVPVVTAVTSNDSAKVTVTDATDLAGDEAARTTTVLITAEDGLATKTYTVVFRLNVGVENLDGSSVEVYPVPANNQLFVKSSVSLSELRVISITGSTLKVVKLSGEKSAELNISNLEDGVYFLKLSGESASQILRFVKN
jgi:Bacterial Ig-like domain (group 2)/Family of unknown function (DUF5689)/Lamin Tail Domain/Secretion system C-terminal sorting domain